MGNGSNHRLKPATVVISVMGTVIAAALLGVLGMSLSTGSDQSDHEASAAPHPIIQNKVDDVADHVEAIDGKVDDLMLMQREQTIILEQIGEDVGELKETGS